MARPFRPLLVAVCLVHDNGKVLLIQRNKGNFAGLWSLPGGKIEHGEHPHESAVRELREETGIQARFEELTATVSEHIYERGRVVAHFLLFLCKVAAPAGARPRTFREGEARWFPLTEVAELPLVPSDRDFIEEFLVKRGHGNYISVIDKSEGGYALREFRKIPA
ncbi:MAG TPA: NUDIX domain-containing protein [archaeon]|nr:NUDIX domain-containing protein [archaeon]